jgi:uncharacterized protein (DUF302 family)
MLRKTIVLAVFAALLAPAGSRAVALADSGDNECLTQPGVSYYYRTPVGLPFADAVERAKDELKALGFGVLWEMDFQAKMKEKLDKDIPPYMILGACHPGLAYDVYAHEDWIGILMPCNVVVRELADGTIEVGMKNALNLPRATGNDELTPIVAQVDALGRQFIDAMSEAAPVPASTAP